jgi:hypothetical protein
MSKKPSLEELAEKAKAAIARKRATRVKVTSYDAAINEAQSLAAQLGKTFYVVSQTERYGTVTRPVFFVTSSPRRTDNIDYDTSVGHAGSESQKIRRSRVRQARGKTMFVVLAATHNPDFNEKPGDITAPRKNVGVSSLEEASRVVRAYITEHNLGGGNWYSAAGAGEVRDPSGKLVGRVHYNGKTERKS